MNELENLRHVQSNSGNNQSLGEFSRRFPFVGEELDGFSLAVLLKGFFSFYEKFDFQTSLVTLLQRENSTKSSCIQSGKDKDWPIFLENPLVPSMNTSKNLAESEGERFRSTCAKASQVLSNSSTMLSSLFEECRQSVPSDLIARAYPAPIAIMPDLDTDLDQEVINSSN